MEGGLHVKKEIRWIPKRRKRDFPLLSNPLKARASLDKASREIFYPHTYTVIVKRAFLWFNAEEILYKIFMEADG